jgi:hypothetical protein
MFFNQDDSHLSDTSQTTVATFHPELMKWLICSYLQLETNQPINHCVHLHVAESWIFPHSVEPECSLLCLQDRFFLRLIQFHIVLQCAPGISKWSVYFRFSGLNVVCRSFPRKIQGFARHITEFIVIFGKNYKLWRFFPFFIFLLRSLFSKILSLCSSFNARGNVLYRGADKSLARPPSRCILFDG